jgi:hypothetical protein
VAERRRGIRGALESLPAKPGVAIAAALVAATLGVYYFNNYSSCTARRDARERFHAAVAEAAARDGTLLRLSDVVTTAWAEVSILGGREIQGRKIECPLGWDRSWTERLALARDGDLAVLIFSSDKGEYIDFLDIRPSLAAFTEVPARYGRDAAVFEVRQTGNNPVRYELSEAGP